MSIIRVSRERSCARWPGLPPAASRPSRTAATAATTATTATAAARTRHSAERGLSHGPSAQARAIVAMALASFRGGSTWGAQARHEPTTRRTFSYIRILQLSAVVAAGMRRRRAARGTAARRNMLMRVCGVVVDVDVKGRVCVGENGPLSTAAKTKTGDESRDA